MRVEAAVVLVAMVVLASAAPALAREGESWTVSVDFYLAAVDESGRKGTLIPATLTVRYPGEGRILVSSGGGVDEVAETSMEEAVKLASLLAGVDWRTVDFNITLHTGSRVGGPSGSAMVALVAYTILAGSPTPNYTSEIVVTGAISPEGLVASVGGVEYKCEAAREAGLTLYYPLVNLTAQLIDECGGVNNTYTGILNLTSKVYGSPPLKVSLKVFPLPREFNETMRDAALEMAEKAKKLLEAALEEGAQRESINATMRTINSSLEIVDTHPYAAASLAFTALRNATIIYYSVKAEEEGFLDSVAENVSKQLERIENILDSMPRNGSIYYLEFVATAYTRLADARSSLLAYEKYSSAGRTLDAVVSLATASARIDSIMHWIRSANASRNSTPTLSGGDVERLAYAVADYAETTARYARAIANYVVENYGRSPSLLVYIDIIDELVSKAREYMGEGNYLAAIGFYREALSRSLSMLFQASLGSYRGPEPILDDYMAELERLYTMLASRLLAAGASPGLAPAYYDYGLVLWNRGDPASAILMLEEASASAITWATLLVARSNTTAPPPMTSTGEAGGGGVEAPAWLAGVAVAMVGFLLGYIASLRAVAKALGVWG